MKDVQDQEPSRVDASEFLLAIESWRKCASRKPPSKVSYRGALVIGAPKDRATIDGERRYAEECERLRGEKEKATERVLELGRALALSLKEAGVSPLPVLRIVRLVEGTPGLPAPTVQEWAELLAQVDCALLEARLSVAPPTGSEDPVHVPVASLWLDAEQATKLLVSVGETCQGGSPFTSNAFRKRITSAVKRKGGNDPYRILARCRDHGTGKYPMAEVAMVAEQIAAVRRRSTEALFKACEELRREREIGKKGVGVSSLGRGSSLLQ